jgi:deoxyribodipyrimidine photo-lyase
VAECVIHWFRRDLRLRDNLALEAALRTGVPVVPVFILDARILAQPTMGERRVQFLRTALLDLDRQLRERDSRLLVLHSPDPPRELNRLAEATGAWALFFNRDYTPYARWRDTRATRGMQMTGVVTMPMDDLLLVPPLRTVEAEGDLPHEFDAFSGRWFAALDLEPEAPSARGEFQPAPELPETEPGWEAMLSPGQPMPSAFVGATEPSAEARLAEFVASGLAEYDTRARFPGDPGGTSRLSAALKFGTISVRRVARSVLAFAARTPAAQAAAERFIRELAWREFAHHLLFHQPDLLRAPLNPRAEAPAASTPGGALEAWLGARTGIPLVDAGLRQMNSEGWMHDRARVVVASFLAHQLGADWRAGERHFARHLVDLDLASNDLGWQRAAGVGVDSPTRARILDPRREGESIDPSGEYVRRHVPELARVPDDYLHHPWDMPPEVQAAAGCRVGIDYPSPIAPAAPPPRR